MCNIQNIVNETEGRYILKLILDNNLGTPRKNVQEINIEMGRDVDPGEEFYWYNGPMDTRNRYFCHEMLKLDKVFQKYEINYLSRKLGYDVFTYKGSYGCRHDWIKFQGKYINTPAPTMNQLQGLTAPGMPYSNPNVKNPKTYTNY